MNFEQNCSHISGVDMYPLHSVAILFNPTVFWKRDTYSEILGIDWLGIGCSMKRFHFPPYSRIRSAGENLRRIPLLIVILGVSRVDKRSGNMVT